MKEKAIVIVVAFCHSLYLFYLTSTMYWIIVEISRINQYINDIENQDT